MAPIPEYRKICKWQENNCVRFYLLHLHTWNFNTTNYWITQKKKKSCSTNYIIIIRGNISKLRLNKSSYEIHLDSSNFHWVSTLNVYFLPTTKETIAFPNKVVLLCGRQIRSCHTPADPLHTQIKIITDLQGLISLTSPYPSFILATLPLLKVPKLPNGLLLKFLQVSTYQRGLLWFLYLKDKRVLRIFFISVILSTHFRASSRHQILLLLLRIVKSEWETDSSIKKLSS